MDGDPVSTLVEIKKSAEKDEYRNSHFERLNPRSKTEVRNGSMPRRAVAVGAGMIAGGVAGRLAGTGAGAAAAKGATKTVKGRKFLKEVHRQGGSVTGAGANVGGYVGAAGGAVAGAKHNLSTGDTKATHRKSRKKATGAAYVPGAGVMWRYKEKS